MWGRRVGDLPHEWRRVWCMWCWTHRDLHSRHKITKGKESNRCDLCRTLWITEGRFNTEDDLPIQTLGHIQHQCETLSEIHTLTNHRCWCIIHTELGRLRSSKWWFICINGQKKLKTILNDLEHEFPKVFNSFPQSLLYHEWFPWVV